MGRRAHLGPGHHARLRARAPATRSEVRLRALRRRARDVNRKGSIDKFKGVKLKVLGPADVGLMEFSRVHELDAGAGAELIGGAAVSSRLKRTRTVKLSLGNPVKFFIDDQIQLLSDLMRHKDWPESAQAMTLAQRDHFLVT